MPDASRLLRSVVPTRYDLELAPDLAGASFSGVVRIELDVREAVDELALNALDLGITTVNLVQADRSIGVEVNVEPDSERLRLVFDEALAPGAAALTLTFDGRLADALVGFYRSRFVDDSGTERRLAATQFEAPHARRAFPCFDEPEFKAVFSIALVVDEDLVALSNGPEIERTPLGDGRVRIRFGDTIPMSTYLVAVVVGPLEISGPVDAGGIPVRMAHAPGKGHLTAYALDVAAFALTYFADYYGIPYPAEKLDLVALPDFAFGAMENLGCVTFRETLLLIDLDTIPQVEATQAALTIVHEVAHMWFGDLVTMKWWNGIWLNEAFATFMERAGVDAYRLDLRVWDDFAIGRAAAFEIDALAATRPVEYEVRTPQDAEGMFDALTYQKGGSVVRMLERWMGADAFRSGVRHYLDRYQYANTETTDLWDALETDSGTPARRIMDSWIFQPGFPQITVARNGDEIRLTQQRFTYGAPSEPQRWSVPVLARIGDRTESLLLDDDEITFRADPGALVVVHGGGENFFRVNYPAEWRNELVEAGACNALERFALVDDAWAGMLAGQVTAAEFWDFCRRFESETDLLVWRGLVARLHGLSHLAEGDALDTFERLVGDLVRPMYARLGWQPAADEGPRTRQLRGLLIDTLGTLANDPEVIERARGDHDDPEVASAAMSVIATTGTVAEFNDFVSHFQHAPTPQERIRYLYALGQFPVDELVMRACEMATDGTVRSQNAPFVVQRALKHRRHGRLAWEYVRDNWPTITEKFPRVLIPRMFEGVAWLVDDESVADVPAFVTEHPVGEGHRTVAQHLERQQVHRATFERERERFATGLAQA